MLEGMRSNDIIVGAYTDGDGVCPMLAAHRNGGRTNLISFARAWDRFAYRGTKFQVARRATSRELLVLRTHLEASLLDEDAPAAEMAVAVAEHRELMARRAAERDPGTRHTSARDDVGARIIERDPGRIRPGDPDRSKELRNRHGWSWLRVFRRYDDYELALERLHSEHDALRTRELAGVE
jgi:hypothetical protein